MTDPIKYQPEKAWACVWPNGSPKPFIIVHSTWPSRLWSQSVVGQEWAHIGETERQGWKRAYRAGCRCVRVTVTVDD